MERAASTLGLLERLKAGHAAIRTVVLGEAAVGLRILTEADYAAAEVEAIEWLRALKAELTPATAEAFEGAKGSALLARLVIDPAIGGALFASAQEARETLSREQKTLLLAEYIEHEREYSPSERRMPEADFAALLEEVKKNGPGTAALLNDSSFATLKRLITSLVAPPSS